MNALQQQMVLGWSTGAIQHHQTSEDSNLLVERTPLHAHQHHAMSNTLMKQQSSRLLTRHCVICSATWNAHVVVAHLRMNEQEEVPQGGSMEKCLSKPKTCSDQLQPVVIFQTVVIILED